MFFDAKIKPLVAERFESDKLQPLPPGRTNWTLFESKSRLIKEMWDAESPGVKAVVTAERDTRHAKAVKEWEMEQESPETIEDVQA